MNPATSVLVVDDDDSIREFVHWVLSDEGYEVLAAPNGAAALALLEGVIPDVILLDMRMPVMDGWEFTRVYRQRHGVHAPIVVLTAAHDAAASAAQIDASGYLAKPFDLGELLELIEQYRRD